MAYFHRLVTSPADDCRARTPASRKASAAADRAGHRGADVLVSISSLVVSLLLGMGCERGAPVTDLDTSSVVVLRAEGPRLTVDTARGVGCRACAIDVVPIWTIGDAADPVLFRGRPSATTDGRGITYVYVVGATDHEVVIIGKDGRFQGVLGRFGSGPGEFRSVNGLTTLPGDSVLLIHEGRIATVYSPGGEFVRRFTLHAAPQNRVIVLSHDRLAFSIHPGTQPEGPIQLVSGEGELTATIGQPNVTRSITGRRALAPGTSGTALWAAEVNNYRIEHVALDGTILSEFAVVPTHTFYMPPVRLGGEFADTTITAAPASSKGPSFSVGPGVPRPPTARIAGLQEDDEGFLWVAIHAAAHDFMEVRMPDGPRNHAEGRPIPLSVDDQRYATVIDVLDPQTGRRIASTRVPGLGLFDQRGGLFVGREREDGIIAATKYVLRLTR